MANKYVKTGFILAIFLVSRAAFGGVVFTPPQNGTNPADTEEFPESHFGPGYAAQQVNDMESPDEESGKNPATASRGIASVGGNPNAGVLSNDSAIVTSQASATQDISDSVVARKGVQEVSIIASDLGYFPKTVFVSRDVPVRMYVTGSSKNTLCIMMDSFQIRKQVRAQKIEEITFIPNIPGTYRFYCPVNGMEGSLVVKELSQLAEEPMQQPEQLGQAPVSNQRFPAATGRTVPQVQAGWESALDHAGGVTAGAAGR